MPEFGYARSDQPSLDELARTDLLLDALAEREPPDADDPEDNALAALMAEQRCGSASMPTTSTPASANATARGKPTYPMPMTAIFTVRSRSSCRSGMPAAAAAEPQIV